MPKKEISKESIIEALSKIAFGKPNAAIELAYMEKPSRSTIRQLDLSAVSEFKRNSAGSVEIKLIDRVKALEALASMLGGDTDGEQLAEFIHALEEAGEEQTSWQE